MRVEARKAVDAYGVDLQLIEKHFVLLALLCRVLYPSLQREEHDKTDHYYGEKYYQPDDITAGEFISHEYTPP